MNRYQMTIALAATDDGHMPFGIDQAGLDTSMFPHRIVAAFPWNEPLEVEADTLGEALEVAYREANIGTEGWAARYRAGRQRSLSVGDLVIVEDGHRSYTFQVLSSGFGYLEGGEKILRESPWSFEAADSVLTDEALAALR